MCASRNGFSGGNGGHSRCSALELSITVDLEKTES